MKTLSIPIKCFVKDNDFSGEECECCGDIIFLNQKQLFVSLGKREVKTDIYFCQCCADLLEFNNQT